jgi:tagatose 6-phosphate kinase
MILVVGLSPAWQRTVLFESLIPGRVNRAKRVRETASGKGVNVARVASILGAKIRLLTVAGGRRGKLLENSLRETGIGARIIHVESETRICQTLLALNTATELVEEAGPLSAAEVENVMRAFAAEVQRAELVVLTGTVPKGCGNDFYARLVDESRRHKVQVLIDAQAAQLRNALRRRPFLVRVNRDELIVATRTKDGRRSGIPRALDKLMRDGPQWAVISDGAKRVCVGEGPGKHIVTLKPPHVQARNAIGSGDAMMAGIATGLLRGRSMLNAVRLGIACGAANAMTLEPGLVRQSDVRRLCWTRNKRVPIV